MAFYEPQVAKRLKVSFSCSNMPNVRISNPLVRPTSHPSGKDPGRRRFASPFAPFCDAAIRFDRERLCREEAA